MNCPTCATRLRFTKVIQAGAASTKAAECQACDKRWTFVTLLVGEIKTRGDGPYAIAKRLRAGEDPKALLS